MTRQEFIRGWKLLVLQPWGWRYNQLTKDGRPTDDALAQLDLYFAELRWAHADAWAKVAKMYACGKDWPCLNDLTASLRAVQLQFVRGLPDRVVTETCECPPEVAAILARVTNGATFSRGADSKGEV